MFCRLSGNNELDGACKQGTISCCPLGVLNCAGCLWQVGDGGTVFFRESCFKQSGDKARKSNPTHYR